jgi:hypothetical protein
MNLSNLVAYPSVYSSLVLVAAPCKALSDFGVLSTELTIDGRILSKIHIAFEKD